MAHYAATVTTPVPPEDVFTYLADFRTVAEWDPSITSSVHLNADEPIEVGAIFRVTTKTAGQEVVLDFETEELQRPRLIKLKGENDSMVSHDTITIEPTPEGGSAVTYDAQIEMKGAKKLADPLVHLGFQRLGNKARDGLAEKLNNLS